MTSAETRGTARGSIAAKAWLALGLASAAGIATGCKKPAGSASGAGPGAGAPPAAVASAAPAAGLALPSGFEGEIDLTATGEGGKPMSLAVLVKGHKARLDVPEELAKASASPFASNAYAIVDGDAKKLYGVLDARRQVIVVDLSHDAQGVDALSARRGEHPGAPHGAPPKIAKTGRYETVAGYDCEDWDVVGDHKEASICMADEGFSWLKLPAAALPADRAWVADLLDGKHFPLRFVGYAADGVKESARLEVTRIVKKPIAGPELEYPPGYVVTDLGAMLRGLGAMGGMGGIPFPSRPAPGAPPLPPKPSKAN